MQEQPHRRGGFLRLLLSLVIIGLAFALFINRQYVIDRYTVSQFKPSTDVAALVTASKMNDRGKFYFYASEPELNDRNTFNNKCTSAGEQTVVLGCYAAQRIYIFNVTDDRLNGIKQVTAAHEMLHAAYDRLSRSEKAKVNSLLETQLSSVQDERIKDLIKIYDKTEPGERLNELHSIFATELKDVNSELESYYQTYFTDRASIVSLSKQYESVFSSIKLQQAELLAELKQIAADISSRSDQYNEDAEQLNKDIASFNQRANNNGYSSQSAFNADRQILLNKQSLLATNRTTINGLISEYNQKRKVLEDLNGQAQDLNKSINSNSLEPAPAL